MTTNIEGNVLLDYLSFTVPFSEAMMKRVFSALDVGEEEANGFGGMGYTESAPALDGGRVFWHPDRPGMGIHIRLPAASIAMSGFTALGLINRALDMGGRITRVDIAFDDYSGTLDLDEMYEKLRKGEVVTRFRRVARIEGGKLGEYGKTGDTINIGARASQAFIRIYDKKREQEAKKKETLDIENWVRVEMELKGDKAHVFAGMLSRSVFLEDLKTAAQLCSDLLFGLLDFKQPSVVDTNKTRWDTSEWWQEFVRSTGKLTLGIPLRHRTLDDTKAWIKTQVATSLAMIILSYPDDNDVSGFDFIMNCAVEGAWNISKPQQKALDLYNEQQKEKMEQSILPT